MKKIISSALICAMLIALGSNAVMAESNMENVLADVKTRIMDTSEFEKFTSSTETDTSGRNVYNFIWSSPNSEKNEVLNISADDNGVILDYSRHNLDDAIGYRDELNFNKMSTDEAMVKAQELLKKLNPTIGDSLVLEKTSQIESLYDNDYSFNVSRIENNIKVYENTGYLTVNEDATEIKSFGINYTEGLEFGDGSVQINSDDAWAKFAENSGLELVYLTKYEDNKKSVYLAYVPKIEYDEYIDAQSGELKEIKRILYAASSGGGSIGNLKEESLTMDSSINFTPQELEELETVSNLISKEDAEKKIRENQLLDIDENMVLDSFRIYKDAYSEDRYASLNFSYSYEDGYYHASASMDATTGDLLSWYNYNTKEKEDSNYSDEELNEIAHNALKELSPKHFADDSQSDYREYTPKYYNEEYYKNSSTYEITMYRYVNNVVYRSDSANIAVNKSNGKVSSFNVNYTNIEFPSTEGILSEQEVINKLKEQTNLTLYYIPQPSNDEVRYDDTVVLGYKLDDRSMKIDPKTGLINKNKFDTDKNAITYDDISGHYAEQQITTLAKFGIGFEGGKFMPDELITQKDFIALLAATACFNQPIVIGKGTDTNYYYEYGIDRGLLEVDESKADQPITRLETAVYMIRALNLEDVAELQDIYNCPFPDVTDNVGYVSILSGMKIFKGDENGNFNPDTQLTRADAAILIYNYLSR